MALSKLCPLRVCYFDRTIHQTQLIIFRIKTRKKPVEYTGGGGEEEEEEREKGREEETVHTLLFFLSYPLFEMIGGGD